MNFTRESFTKRSKVKSEMKKKKKQLTADQRQNKNWVKQKDMKDKDNNSISHLDKKKKMKH